METQQTTIGRSFISPSCMDYTQTTGRSVEFPSGFVRKFIDCRDIIPKESPPMPSTVTLHEISSKHLPDPVPMRF